MLGRLCRVATIRAACLLAASLIGGEVRGQGGQGRIPIFGPGVAIPDASDRNTVTWLGGDSPYGTYLAPDVSFWAFGDTFLANPGVVGRQLTSIVTNTIAIGQIHDGTFVPRYFYRGDLANKQPFFPHPDQTHKYWPKASLMVRGKLYVFLSAMYYNPKPPANDIAGAQDTGSIIARVNNPLDIPIAWKIDFLAFHLENAAVMANLKMGVEIIPAEDGHDSVIVYGFYNNARSGAAKSVVLLVSAEGLERTSHNDSVDPSQVQYLAADPGNANPRWKPGFGRVFDPTDDYFDTQIGLVSGFTVRWNATLARWQVLGANSEYAARYTYPPGNPYVPIPYAHLLVHSSPFGPFRTTPGGVNCYFYTFSELNSPDPTLYCYTARQWIDPKDSRLNTDANILLTYTYSARDLKRQETDLTTYQTHAILLPHPYSGSTPNRSCAPIPPAALAGPASPRPFETPGVPKPLPFPLP